MRSIFHNPRQQPGVVEVVVLDEWDGCCSGPHGGPCVFKCQLFDGDVGVPNHGGTENHPHPNLTDDLEASCQPFFVLLENLDVVVDEPNGPEPQGAEDHQLSVDVGQIRKQERGHKDGAKHDGASHGGGALRVHLAFQAEVAHNLSNLHQLQPLDDALAKQNAHRQRGHQAHARSDRDNAEQAGARQVVDLAKVGEEVVEHGGIEGWGVRFRWWG